MPAHYIDREHRLFHGHLVGSPAHYSYFVLLSYHSYRGDTNEDKAHGVTNDPEAIKVHTGTGLASASPGAPSRTGKGQKGEGANPVADGPAAPAADTVGSL